MMDSKQILNEKIAILELEANGIKNTIIQRLDNITLLEITGISNLMKELYIVKKLKQELEKINL